MTELRTAALDAAIRTHGHSTTHSEADVVRAAAAYLAFLSGEATTPAASAEKPPTKKALKAAAVTAESAASLTAPAGQAAVTATPAATVTAPVTSTVTPISAPAVAKGPTEIAPPTTIQLAAESLKALVQDKSPGRGREVAVALLKEFEVEQLAQIQPTRLAEFKQRCDTAGKATPAAGAAHDPTGGLLG